MMARKWRIEELSVVAGPLEPRTTNVGDVVDPS